MLSGFGDNYEDTKGAEFMWIAVISPDTPDLGVRENVETTQSQVAAPIAAFVGENFRAASPKAAAPLPGWAWRRLSEIQINILLKYL